MTCSRCATENTKYPTPTEWGPLVWKILHTLAEYAGKQKNEMIRLDEGRAWPLLMKNFVAMLPCELCRIDATNYIKEHPFQLPEAYSEWNLYVRTYVYSFHEYVNQKTGKSSFDFNQLSETYKKTGELTAWMKQLYEMVQRAIKLNGVHIQQWNTFQNNVRMVIAAIGL